MSKPDLRIFTSIDEFREAAKATPDAAADDLAGSCVRCSFETEEVKAGDEGVRTLTFTISTNSVDRYGDSIAIDGWQLDNFKKNPVVLWAHQSWSLPVAKAGKIWTYGGKLKAEAEFTPMGLHPFNDTVFEMYRQGFLSATSVGFLPLKFAFVDDPQRRFGIDFIEQELLEFSAVPVPANAEALIQGKSAGINIAPLLDWAEAQLRLCADSTRIVKLAESVLGSSGTDLVALAWAERIVTSAGKAIVSRERVERIESAAKQHRLDKAKRKRDIELIRARAG